jgi:hypothetical protein
MQHGLHPLDGEPLRPPAGWTPDPTFPKARQGDLEELGTERSAVFGVVSLWLFAVVYVAWAVTL